MSIYAYAALVTGDYNLSSNATSTQDDAPKQFKIQNSKFKIMLCCFPA